MKASYMVCGLNFEHRTFHIQSWISIHIGMMCSVLSFFFVRKEWLGTMSAYAVSSAIFLKKTGCGKHSGPEFAQRGGGGC
jgi:hypothetical protein